ncbi:hypothetical protein [Streptomyces sp. NPDC088785]|uniref:hypothetical protein n=1 Tax=Streptomyces sp. NPDC088785 TaxID=3365897 RepID=UPI00380F9FC8
MTVALVLLTSAFVLLIALLSCVGAGTLARIDGATWPAAVLRAARCFAAVLALAAGITAAVAPFLT